MHAIKPGFCLLLLLGAAGFLLQTSGAQAQMVTGTSPQGNMASGANSPSTPPPMPLPEPRQRAPIPTDLDPDTDITLMLGSTPTTFRRISMQNLSQAFVKLTGIDLEDNQMIDDFALINHCSIYQRYFNDEFAWRQAREAFRRVIQREIETYPENVYLLGTVALGRYDFDRKAFMLDEESRLNNVGAFRFQDRSFTCQGGAIKQMPLSYNIRLSNPVTLDRLEVSEEKAHQITQIMQQENNKDRKIYITFFMRINDFTTQGATTSTSSIRATMRATLMSLRFYLDRQRKILIYEYTGEE